MTLSILSSDAAGKMLIGDWCLPNDATKDSVYSECLRNIVWAYTAGANPVHTSRILNRAVDLILQLPALQGNENNVRESLKTVMGHLATIGDLVDLAGGLWLPGSMRIIDFGPSHQGMLVGGIPTRSIPVTASASLNHRTFFRFISGVPKDFSIALDLPIETGDSWAELPQMSLADWGKSILDIELTAYTAPTSDGDRMQVYCPSKAPRGSTQAKRWFENAGSLPSGRYLARRVRVYGVHEYRIIDIKDGKIIQSAGGLQPGEARRLMYTFDEAAANPVRAKWTVCDKTASLVLWSEIPRAEQRLFFAFGKLAEGTEYYPRRWQFEAAHELVRARLNWLGISLVGGKPNED